MNRRLFLKMAAFMSVALHITGIATLAEQTPKASRPNILFCLADDASYPHMGAYGCSWVTTPGFDRVAREGLLFNRAYTPNTKCAPSRACILTGRNSWQLEEAANHCPFFPGKFKTYPEALKEQGYFVGFTGKGFSPGHPGLVNGKRRELTGKGYQQHTTEPPTEGIAKTDYTANFRDFLADKPADEPFCFWYGGHEPHRAYEFESGIKKGGKKLSDLDSVPKLWPDNDTVKTDLLDYAYEIEYFDKHLQNMLTILDQQGMLDNTLVIVTADNGMPFPRVKGQEYEYSNHLPMAIMWKNGIANPGRKINDFVSLIDLTPTCLELAGVSHEQSGLATIQGQSLMNIFTSDKAEQVDSSRDHVLIGKERHDIGRPKDVGYPIRGIVKGEFLYLINFENNRWPAGNPETGYLNCDGSPTKTAILQGRKAPDTQNYWQMAFGKRAKEELYNIKNDRECMTNLAEDEQYSEIKTQLQTQMIDELRDQNDPRIFGNGAIFDKYPYSNENNRHFYEKYMRGQRIKANWVNKSDFEKELIK